MSIHKGEQFCQQPCLKQHHFNHSNDVKHYILGLQAMWLSHTASNNILLYCNVGC